MTISSSFDDIEDIEGTSLTSNMKKQSTVVHSDPVAD